MASLSDEGPTIMLSTFSGPGAPAPAPAPALAGNGPVKRIALIRHGQGWHNRSWRGVGLAWLVNILDTEDVTLTERGRSQATVIRDAMDQDDQHKLRQVEAVAVSPLSRTIETATLIFSQRPQIRFHLQPLCAERCLATCDRGSPKATLVKRWPHIENWSGFAEMDEVWWPSARTFAQEMNPQDRIRAFKQWLAERPETTLAVVGHAGYFNCMAGVRLGNCEVRWFTLQRGPDGELELVPGPDSA